MQLLLFVERAFDNVSLIRQHLVQDRYTLMSRWTETNNRYPKALQYLSAQFQNKL